MLDPANYGSLTITGPVSIEGHGWASTAPVVGQAAITINANQGDKINIIGVVLDGTALVATISIQFNSGGSLMVRDSVIRNFTGFGILFAPNSSTSIQLYVSNTLISDNGFDGIRMAPSGAGSASGVLNRVQLENNFNGLEAISNDQNVDVTVTNSVSANNAGDGISATSEVGNAVGVTVRNSTIAGNGQNGLWAQNAGVTICATRSTITGNNAAWATSSAGVVLSYGDNNIDGYERQHRTAEPAFIQIAMPALRGLGSVLNKDSSADRIVIQGSRIGGGLDEEATLLARGRGVEAD